MNEDSIGSKPDLLGLGTRYAHIMELKEVFMQGVAIIDQMIMKSEGDRRTKAKLEIAVEMINKRLDHLSDFNDKTHDASPLAREVRAAGIHRAPAPLMLEANNDKSGAEKPKSQIIDQSNRSQDSSTQPEDRV